MRDLMTCRECVDLLLDFLDGNLEKNIEERLDAHLSACPPCVNFLDTYRSTSINLGSLLRDQEVEIPGEVKLRLRSFLHESLTEK